MSIMNTGFQGVPSITDILSTTENILWWGLRQQQKFLPGVIVSTTTDAGNSPTTMLRQGLLLGRNTSTGKLAAWDPTATSGVENIYGVLTMDQSMLGAGAVAADKYFGYVFVGGNLKASAVLRPAAANLGLVGADDEYLIRSLLTSTGRFIIDDQVRGATVEWLRQEYSGASAARAVVAADHDTLFIGTHSALTVYTIPTASAATVGLRFGFVAYTNTGVRVTATTAGDIVTYNDIAANSVEYSTTAKTIGGFFEVLGIRSAATTYKWLIIPRLADLGQIITPAT